ncbi:hypothetical protein BDA96_02G083200 [Sorghum bicolor]|uniref:Uncharacterized protein n=1 Tax=Sorghum bicolor TaxID=4558 RepID=A0A921RKP0_SORBI|nr:hypothetical protein BDA96_02G083200 [Sorghum bicolor]
MERSGHCGWLPRPPLPPRRVGQASGADSPCHALPEYGGALACGAVRHVASGGGCPQPRRTMTSPRQRGVAAPALLPPSGSCVLDETLAELPHQHLH